MKYALFLFVPQAVINVREMEQRECLETDFRPLEEIFPERTQCLSRRTVREERIKSVSVICFSIQGEAADEGLGHEIMAAQLLYPLRSRVLAQILASPEMASRIVPVAPDTFLFRIGVAD